MTIAYISLGSNLDDPVSQVQTALASISEIEGVDLIKVSSLYHTKPMGTSQPDYINAVAKIDTTLKPLALLHALQTIENQQGRVRSEERWGPRTIDLDIQLYGNEAMDTDELTIPHYGLKERDFVLMPLFEIEPDLVLPD